MVSPSIAAIVLAAGAGTRFSQSSHKLLAKIDDRTVIELALDAVCTAGFNHVLLVQGAVDLSQFATDSKITLVDSPNWRQGQAHSLQAGLAVAGDLGCEAVVVGLGDQPGVPPSAWRSVGSSAGKIVTATFDGQRSPPVKIHRDVWDDLPTEGDEGARALISSRPDLVKELPCQGSPQDIDTAEDLARWS